MVKLNSEFIDNLMIEELIKKIERLPARIEGNMQAWEYLKGLKPIFVPIRKKGKLPAMVISEEYDLEYGKDKIEIHKDAILPGKKVLLVDDLIATGGTALAACNLINKLGGVVTECCFIVDLPDLGGRKKLEANGYKVFNLVEFEGE